MLRSLSPKAWFAVLAGAIVVLGLVAFAWDYQHQRTRMREHAAAAVQGDPRRGEAMFIQYGCGSCHQLTNVRNATGLVGPPLDTIALRTIIAGRLSNTPKNMERWIRDPQHVSPGTAMPDLGVSEGDARDITAFLYSRAK